MSDTGLVNDSPDPDDTPEYWEHNEYQALKMMFEGAAYYLRAREDQETYGRYKADLERLRMLETKFRPSPDQ